MQNYREEKIQQGKRTREIVHDKDSKIFDQIMLNLPFNVLTISLNIVFITIKLILSHAELIYRYAHFFEILISMTRE
jgi:hypothetical protein